MNNNLVCEIAKGVITGIFIATVAIGAIATMSIFVPYENANSCCIDGNFSGVYIDSVFLFSGTASNDSFRGTSVLALSLNNGGAATNMTRIILSGTSLSSVSKIYQCSNQTSCTLFSAARLPEKTIKSFDTNATAFHLSTPSVLAGDTYDYVLSFANEQSISGSLIAQDPTRLPIGPSVTYSSASSNSYANQSLYTSSCTIAPYTTSTWANFSGTIITTIETINC